MRPCRPPFSEPSTLRSGFVLSFLLATASPAMAQTPGPQWPRPSPVRPAAPGATLDRTTAPKPAPVAVSPSSGFRVLATVDEVEPNDGPATATPLSIGDTVAGAIGWNGDVDWYVLTVPANSLISADVDASVNGSPLDPVLMLHDSTGEEVIGYNDDSDGLDSHLVWYATAEGRYYLSLHSYSGQGSGAHVYTLGVTTLAVDEVEPNDDAATATPLALGDSLTAVMASASDQDWFELSVDAAALVRLDVRTWELGSQLYPGLALRSGETVLAAPDDSRIERWLDAGTYHLVVTRRYGADGQPYMVIAESLPTGPADPTTTRVAAGAYAGVAAAPGGRIYAVDLEAARVVRIDADGSITSVYENSGWRPVHVVRDGIGDLIVAEYGEQSYPSGWRVVAVRSGRVLPLVTGLNYVSALQVGPDGDLWVGTDNRIRRYSPTGASRSAVATGHTPFDLAFAPDGTLHFTTGGSTIYRVGSTTQPFHTTANQLFGGLAFDAAGRLYVTTFDAGVWLLDAAGVVIHEPVARTTLHHPPRLAFLLDDDGAPLRRLIAMNDGWRPPGTPAVVELNPAGVEHAGHRWIAPVDAVAVALELAARTVLGETGLITAEAAQYLDLTGNRNGGLDVGDLVALLQSEAAAGDPSAIRALQILFRRNAP